VLVCRFTPLSTPILAAKNYLYYEENNKANKVVNGEPCIHDRNISIFFNTLTALSGLVKPIYRFDAKIIFSDINALCI
jgi:hypothetical protein